MTEPTHALALTGGERLTDQSFEILRLWVDHGGGSNAWIAADVLTDPRAYGRLIADALRHGARAYTVPGRSEEAALAAILDGFEQTMRAVAPTIVVPRRTGDGA